jgi:hypothetical protein
VTLTRLVDHSGFVPQKAVGACERWHVAKPNGHRIQE